MITAGNVSVYIFCVDSLGGVCCFAYCKILKF